MAELNYAVNPNEADEGSFDIVPAGDYTAIIESSDLVPTKNNTGTILKLTYQVIDGQFKGRKIFENLNLENQNKQAEQIARKTLNAIGVACGVENIQDSSQLHNIPMILEIQVKNDATYGQQNRIKKHSPLNGTATKSSAPASKTAASAASNTPPWAKK